MRTRLQLCILLMVSAGVFAQQEIIYMQDGRTCLRDSSGRLLQNGTTTGNRTTYRDASGKMTGSATRDGNRTTFRDASGRLKGTQSK